jgi:hypothetical protein
MENRMQSWIRQRRSPQAGGAQPEKDETLIKELPIVLIATEVIQILLLELRRLPHYTGLEFAFMEELRGSGLSACKLRKVATKVVFSRAPPEGPPEPMEYFQLTLHSFIAFYNAIPGSKVNLEEEMKKRLNMGLMVRIHQGWANYLPPVKYDTVHATSGLGFNQQGRPEFMAEYCDNAGKLFMARRRLNVSVEKEIVEYIYVPWKDYRLVTMSTFITRLEFFDGGLYGNIDEMTNKFGLVPIMGRIECWKEQLEPDSVTRRCLYELAEKHLEFAKQAGFPVPMR